VLHVVNDLPAQSPALAEMVENTSLRIIGGYYDLDSGEVEMLTV
jgi:carbonic anhydrase